MKDLYDLNRFEVQPHEARLDFLLTCETCGWRLGLAGYVSMLDVPKKLAASAGAHSGTDMLFVAKAQVLAARVTLREHHLNDIGGSSTVTTASKTVYFCSRLCRNVYRARLQVALYPHYYPDVEEHRWDKDHPGWDSNIYKPSLLDYVPFDDPDAPSCITCEHGAEDANSDGDSECFHENGCTDEDEVPFKYYQKRKPKENDAK